MSQTLKVVRSDLLFQASFAQPAFELFKDTTQLFHNLFEKLKPYGLLLSDVQLDRASANLGDLELRCFLFNFTTTIRVRLDRLEIRCGELQRLDQPEKLIIDAVEAIRPAAADSSFSTHTLTLSIHGTVPGTVAPEYLKRFSRGGPDNLGPAIGSASTFYFGPDSGRQFASLGVDLSASVDQGVFFRLHAIWDAQRVAISELPGAARELLQKGLSGVDLELEQ